MSPDTLKSVVEMGASAAVLLGAAACLAGLGHGVYESLQDIAGLWESDVRCEPRLDPVAREREMAGWREALQRIRSR